MNRPCFVEETRGETVENIHLVRACLSDSTGKILYASGDIEKLTFPRSALKPIQTLAVLESGAAEKYDITQKEIALFSSSHNGEEPHIEAVKVFLQKIGADPNDLECGTQLPGRLPDQKKLFQSGQEANPTHNNCSGKHSGMLATALTKNWKIKGYIEYNHPVQGEFRNILNELLQKKIDSFPWGIDGCGIPSYAFSLRNIALLAAKFSKPHDQSQVRQNACRHIHESIRNFPFFIAGTNRLCSAFTAIADKGMFLKTGAEGVYMLYMPSEGLGLAIKSEAGNRTAAEVVLGEILRRFDLLDKNKIHELSNYFFPINKNRSSTPVGKWKCLPL